jgi:hypothetical protein
MVSCVSRDSTIHSKVTCSRLHSNFPQSPAEGLLNISAAAAASVLAGAAGAGGDTAEEALRLLRIQ